MFKPETPLFDRTAGGQPTAAGEALARAWDRVLEGLSDTEIERAVRLAEKKHLFKTLPQPGALLTWLDEANPNGQRHAGGTAGLWEVDRVDENGYVFYRRKIS